MVLLDTNILVYAADVDSEVFVKAKEIRDKAVNGELEACVSLQNLAEFYSAVTSSKQVEKPLTPREAKGEVIKYILCPMLKKVDVKSSTISLAMDLAEKYGITKQNIYDTQLVATMIENNITKIFARNVGDFSIFTEIESENPLEVT
ncbi:MAG: hypothetical protein COS29_04010, partial [Candidatus Omnitrophica bacterium CG02_land_8_20_14_3_00__42_8]